MPTIRIPTPLRPYTDGQSEVDVEGNTVGEVLQNLTSKHIQLHQHLYNDAGELRPFVNVFLDNEDVRHLQGETTAVQADARLRIVPSVAGGSRE